MVKLRALSYGIMIIAVLFGLAACDNNVSGPRFTGDTYSLSGLLVSGSPVDAEHPVFITKSSSLEDFSFTELFVPNATIRIFEITNGDTTAVLDLEPVVDLGQNDNLQIPKIKYLDPSGHLIQAGIRYRVEANIPGYSKSIWAETVVPAQVSLETDFLDQNISLEGYSLDPATQDSIAFEGLDSRYPLAVNTGNYTGNLNMFIEIYCMEEFSTDLEWTIPVFGITNPDSSIAWIYNSSGDSMRRISIVAKYVARYFSAQNGNYAMLQDFAQAIAFYGRYRFTVYSVDENYFSYLYKTDGYLNGGVHNALGYFGSASGGKLYTRVVKN